MMQEDKNCPRNLLAVTSHHQQTETHFYPRAETSMHPHNEQSHPQTLYLAPPLFCKITVLKLLHLIFLHHSTFLFVSDTLHPTIFFFCCIYAYIFTIYICNTFSFLLCTFCFNWPEEKAIHNFVVHMYSDNKGIFYSTLFMLTALGSFVFTDLFLPQNSDHESLAWTYRQIQWTTKILPFYPQCTTTNEIIS